MTISDAVLQGMAEEMRNALIARGLDPTNPPVDSNPPIERAFREYCARGGDMYDDPNQFIQALIQEVGR